MSQYSCKIVNNNGEIEERIINSSSLISLKDELENSGEFLISHKIIEKNSKTKKVTTRDIYIFTRELHILLKSGMQLYECLNLISGQIKNIYFRNCIEDLAIGLKEGKRFSESLEKYRDIFSIFYINTIKAGESSGNLVEILDKLAAHEKRIYRLKEKIIKVFSYPAILIIVSISILAFMIFYIVPTFNMVFKDLNINLPITTRIMMKTSTIVKNNVYSVGTLLLFIFLFILISGKTKIVKRGIKYLILKIPFVGTIIGKYEISTFATTMSLLLTGGIPIIESLKIVISSMENKYNVLKFESAVKLVMEGNELSVALDRVKLLDDISIRMIAAGEKSGSLSTMFESISELYEEEIDHDIELISSLIEPILLTIMGLVIGSIVISIFVPVVQMSTAF